MDSSGLQWTLSQPSLPKLYMIGVDWSGVESTGQSSPVGVQMDFYHYKILLDLMILSLLTNMKHVKECDKGMTRESASFVYVMTI